MNKKILKTVKIILWGLVYTLPILHFLISLHAGINVTFTEVMAKYMYQENFIVQVFWKIFGKGGQIYLLAEGGGITQYLAYFIFVSFAHICVDLILFLPDVARFIFDGMKGEKDEDSL